MKQTSYEFTKREFEDLYYSAQEIQGNLCIIKKFCDDFADIDDFYKIIPLMNYTIKRADAMFSVFINKV